MKDKIIKKLKDKKAGTEVSGKAGATSGASGLRSKGAAGASQAKGMSKPGKKKLKDMKPY